jgi:uncharacterized protein (TIGR02246 family)
MSEPNMSDRVRDEVQALLGEFFTAVQRRDLSGFLELFTGDERLTVVENTDRYDWPAFRAFADQFFHDIEQISFELEQSAVNSLAPEVAVATGVFNGRGRTVRGDRLDFRHAFTFALVRHDTRWRIAHAHESALSAA